MLLQLAVDRPESLWVVPRVADLVDIVEVGTPVLKRFGISAIVTVKELAPGVPILADTKTVDAGALEADMVFGAGAAFLTVLSCATHATHLAVCTAAEHHGAWVVVDTLTDGDDVLQLGHIDSKRLAYVSIHSSTDARLAGDVGATDYASAVRRARGLGYRVALAGGIDLTTLDAVVEAGPDVIVVGTAITESPDPRGTVEWMVSRLTDRSRGWPSDAR